MEMPTSLNTTSQIQTISRSINKYLHPLKLTATVYDLSNQYHSTLLIDFDTRLAKKAGFDFDGMQIILEDGTFELSEYQAGPNQDELHVFGEYKSINTAIKALLRGKRKPIKIWG